MKILFAKKQLGITISCVLALGIVSSGVSAESNLIAREYVTDKWNNVVTSDYDECWHTGTALPLLENSIPCKASFAALEAPPVTAVPSIPKVQVVTFNIDTLFDFDKAELQPSGRLELDSFISKLKDIKPETITVIGHTDRIGSDSYNQQLSVQRAQAVKSYMISRGIPVDSIQTFGKGETQPAIKAGDCNGIETGELIHCLQPNRRVEVQVVGSSAGKVD